MIVPELAKTLKQFVAFARPIQTDSEFQVTRKLADDFGKSDIAQKLHNYVNERQVKLNNWLTPWWIDYAYLSHRESVISSSPGVILPKLNYQGNKGQVNAAAKLIQATLSYHHMIAGNLIPAETYRNSPLDMFQFHLMIGTTRIPRHIKDELKAGVDRQKWAKHIIVIRNGHAFKLNVYDDENNIMSLEQLENCLHNDIVKNSHQRNPYPLLAGSCGDRETWAKIWTKMEKQNMGQIKELEEALFVVNLDSLRDDNVSDDEMNSIALNSLTGGGANSNSINRWFDKTLQINVGCDGQVTLTCEHTPMELPPISQLTEFICTKIQIDFFKRKCGKLSENPVKQLNWQIDEEIKANLLICMNQINNLNDSIDVKIHTFSHFGKNFEKHMKLSPDSYIQLALQIAFYRIHHNHPATLEAVQLRKFREGRTETIRLPNMTTANFVEKLHDKKTSKIELSRLLKEAIYSHKQYSNVCSDGLGVDRHLLGLRMAARDLQIESPQIFEGEAYQKMIHFQMITSQVPSPTRTVMGFIPVHADNYGICYNPREKEIIFFITAPKEWKETSAAKLAEELDRALLDMKSILIDVEPLDHNVKL
uniref:Carn_acyltransf domain-containing protein n=1 Tax=Rhabditophanes sp. KR3021 TaxID=114890 RepID=A0AC35TW31_9BILA